MSGFCDEEGLQLLLKAPKKKYLKKLIQLGAYLNVNHNCTTEKFDTPITQNFKADLELTTDEAQRLLIALSDLVELACKINFDFEEHPIFSQNFDQQLGKMLIGGLLAMQTEIETARLESLKEGRKLIDTNWRLDLQIANEAGKSKVPGIILEIESAKEGQSRTEKIQMKGQQFQAFFGNLRKIKNQLLQLVESQAQQK